MRYDIKFSTFVNNTGSEASREELLSFLNALASKEGIEGYTLVNSVGYWAGVNENSYTLELIGITKAKAVKVANSLKEAFNQDAVILIPVKNQSILI